VIYEVVLAPGTKQAMATQLPPAVTAAVVDFVSGPLAQDPFRVGKPLRSELEGKWSARRGEYRVLYTINERVVTVCVVAFAYRRHTDCQR
jgi:mRNA interferase RelE/StbE